MDDAKPILGGDLTAALDQLQSQVRSNPSDVKLRVYLFQLLSVLGYWDRALTQLDVSLDLDKETLVMCQMYREAIRCEKLRLAVFEGHQTPLIFGEPQQWMALCIQALSLTINGEFAQARELRERAYDVAPVSEGHADSQNFAWIADADSRIGPFIETFIGGEYYWVPFTQIQRMQFEQPQDLRDLVWSPCTFTWRNEGQVVGLVPSRYGPLPEVSVETSDLLLARKTQWQQLDQEDYSGLGQRTLITDQAEISLLDIRTITFSQ